MDKPPRRLLPGYEPSDQSPPSSSTTSPSGGSSSNNINNNSAPPATSTSKSSTIGLSSSASTSTASASTRRQVTPLACNECRRVKCKCDGERPTCGLCERKGLVCDYDVGPRGRTALMALRHQYTLLETENNQLRELLRLIAILPTTDASEVLDRLRTNEDPLRVLQMVQAARLLIPEANTTGGSSEGGTLTPVAAAARPTATATPTPMPQQLSESSTKPPNEHSLTQRYSDEKPKLPRQRSSGSSTVPSDLRMILNEPDDDE